MTQSSEIKAEVRAALQAIVSDASLGLNALSDKSLMAGVVKDYLPDAPREAGLLLAAVENGVPAILREHASSGMDVPTAINLTASRFADLTMYTADACHWVVGEFAIALGLCTPAEIDSQVPPPPQAQTLQQAQRPGEPVTQQQWQPQPQPQPQVQGQWRPQPYPDAQQTKTQYAWGGTGDAAFAPGQAGPYQPAAQPAAPGQPRQGRRARPLVITGIVVVLIAAGVTGALLLRSGPAKVPTPVVNVSASSGLVVGNDVVVAYHDGTYSDATISAKLSHTRAGEVAKLMAVQFPFSTSNPATVVSSRNISADSESVKFSVTPSVKTKYSVGVFASGSATKPLASSAVQAIYVTTPDIVKSGLAQPGCHVLACSHGTQCTRPECYVNYLIHIYAPPSALKTEEAKHLYFYFAINESKTVGVKPTEPTTLYLAPKVKAALTKTIAPNEFEVVESIQFKVGNEGYAFRAQVCTRDSLSTDGLGLPVHHGCGDTSIPANAKYLG